MQRRTYFYAALMLTLVTVGFLVVPVVMSVIAGLTKNFFVGLKSGLTLEWVFRVWELYQDTIWRSMGIALACLAITLIAGVPAAYGLALSKSRWARIFEETLILPVAVPGLAIALSLIQTYGGFREFRMSWAFILVGHVLYTLPFMVRSVLAVLSSIPLDEYEEAAASLGANKRRRFFDIVVPNAMPGIMAGSLMVVTLSIGEFNLSWMLHTPLTKTLPVGLADSYASMRLEVASAYTLVFFIMIVPLLIAMQKFGQTGTARKPTQR